MLTVEMLPVEHEALHNNLEMVKNDGWVNKM